MRRVYLRHGREDGVDGMTDPNGPDCWRNPARRLTILSAGVLWCRSRPGGISPR